MSFTWPSMLWLLLAVPVLVVVYRHIDRQRRARQLAALGTMGTARAPTGRPLGWRRHAPPAAFLVGVTILIVALARPIASVDLPRREGTVVLAFDVSNSMLADDLEPNRLQAAKRAARRFVASQPDTIDIGVVAFSTAAFEVLPPTESRDEVRDAIRRLRAEGATSLARGIAASLNTVAGEPLVPDVGPPGAGTEPDEDFVVVPTLPFIGSSAVVLLSDGENTGTVDPLGFADAAGRAGVRIFTVGIGSTEGAVVEIDGFAVSTQLDEELLREIAGLSNGQYYRAADAAALDAVYDSIDLRFTVESERTEITALLAAAALVVFLGAGLLSALWLGRVP